MKNLYAWIASYASILSSMDTWGCLGCPEVVGFPLIASKVMDVPYMLLWNPEPFVAMLVNLICVVDPLWTSYKLGGHIEFPIFPKEPNMFVGNPRFLEHVDSHWKSCVCTWKHVEMCETFPKNIKMIGSLISLPVNPLPGVEINSHWATSSLINWFDGQLVRWSTSSRVNVLIRKIFLICICNQCLLVHSLALCRRWHPANKMTDKWHC